jgi:AraC-like DNA-binding protein
MSQPAPEQNYLDIPTIHINFIEQMVAHPDADKALDKTAQDMLAELRSYSKISITQYVRLFEYLTESLQDEMLKFLPGPVPPGSSLALCHMLYHSPSVQAAIENSNHFYSLFLDKDKELLDPSLFEAKQILTLHMNNVRFAQPMFEQTVVLFLLKLIAWLTNQRAAMSYLKFDFPPMPFNEEFNYLYGVVPGFSSAQTEFQFSENILSFAIRPKISPHDFGTQYLQHLLYRSSHEDIIQKVYAEIAHRLMSDDYDVVHIARVFNVSKHTLSRQLKAQNISYSEILVKARKDKARYLLCTSHSSIEHIAEQLGFKEVASFSRSFKTWTNFSPLQYREANLQSDDNLLRSDK